MSVSSAPIQTPSGFAAAPDQRRTNRLGFLDALRGVAVACVLLQHVAELSWPAYHRFCTDYLQVGQMGVLVFFLCSGFIIPASLERGSLREFWASRIFRLYPLYWVSLAAAFGLWVAGSFPTQHPMSVEDWLVNVTMLQSYAGSPDAIGLYWSLGYEMAFYVGISALFLFGLHRRSVALALLAGVGCVAAALAWEPLLGRPVSLGFFYLSTMLVGTVLYRAYSGLVRRRTALMCVAVVLIGGFALVYSALYGRDRPEELGVASFTPMLASWIGAYVVFGMGLWVWRNGAPRWLRGIGRISYSMYLTQALVFVVIPATPHPLLSAALWVGGTIAVSALTYRLVERPAIALGRRVTRRRDVAPAPLPVSTG